MMNYYQDTPDHRRHSSYDVSLAPKWRHRSSSLGLVNVAGLSPGVAQMNTYSQRAPATPCFMSPRMAFSTQFSCDSPIQILTSGKGHNMLDPGSIPRMRYSLKRIPRRCKIVLILLLIGIGAALFVNRKLYDLSSTNVCDGEDKECEDSHFHKKLTERFLEIVSLEKVQKHFHSFAKDLGIPTYIEGNREASEAMGEQTEEDSESSEHPETSNEATIELLDRRPRNADDEETAEASDEEKLAERTEPASSDSRGPPKDSLRKNVKSRGVTREKRRSSQPQPQMPGQRRPQPQQEQRRPKKVQRGRPQNGRNSGKPGRPVKIPPGVNPRRYGL